MHVNVFVAAATLLIASAGALGAQDGHAGHGAMHRQGEGQHGMQGCPMHAAKTQGPQAALQHREHLGLSADQVQRLEAAHQRMHQAHQQVMPQMQEVQRQAAAAAEAARFDEGTTRALAQRAGQAHADMLLANLRAQHETRGILTAQQRERLAHHGAMGMQCSMMGGGAGHGQGSPHHNH
jgi:Spy/CpxP family protein refolding chaperone